MYIYIYIYMIIYVMYIISIVYCIYINLNRMFMFLLDNSGLGLFDAFFLIRKERNIKLEGGVDDWHRIGEGRDQIEQRRRGIYAHILHTHTHTHIHTLDV